MVVEGACDGPAIRPGKNLTVGKCRLRTRQGRLTLEFLCRRSQCAVEEHQVAVVGHHGQKRRRELTGHHHGLERQLPGARRAGVAILLALGRLPEVMQQPHGRLALNPGEILGRLLDRQRDLGDLTEEELLRLREALRDRHSRQGDTRVPRARRPRCHRLVGARRHRLPRLAGLEDVGPHRREILERLRQVLGVDRLLQRIERCIRLRLVLGNLCLNLLEFGGNVPDGRLLFTLQAVLREGIARKDGRGSSNCLLRQSGVVDARHGGDGSHDRGCVRAHRRRRRLSNRRGHR